MISWYNCGRVKLRLTKNLASDMDLSSMVEKENLKADLRQKLHYHSMLHSLAVRLKRDLLEKLLTTVAGKTR